MVLNEADRIFIYTFNALNKYNINYEIFLFDTPPRYVGGRL